MKHFRLLLLLLLFPLFGYAQIGEKWLSDNYDKREYMVPMRDGVSLFTTVYSPKAPQQENPFLVLRTPYGCTPYGEGRYSKELWDTYWREYVERGYIFVMQDVRGRFMSEGRFEHIRPFIPDKTGDLTDEASDVYDTAEWLIENISGHNGRIGFTGNSYPGFYAVMAALSGHPAVVAVNPQAPATDWFMGDDIHHNGALMLNTAFSFLSWMGQPHNNPTMVARNSPEYYDTDEYSFFLKCGAVKNITAVLGDSIHFWNEMVKHPDYDRWWQQRDHTRHMKDIKPAVLITCGTFDADDLYGPLATYKAIASLSPQTELYIAMGPWYHGGWSKSDGSRLGSLRFGSKTSEYYVCNVELPFFMKYLEGIEPAPKQTTMWQNMETPGGIISKQKSVILPASALFFTGENRWRSMPKHGEWRAEYKSLYLGGGNSLCFETPTTKSLSTTYTSDPANPVPYVAGARMKRDKEYMVADQRFAADREDVACFVTRPLEEDVTIAGEITTELFVSITTTDADFVVKLIDVFPDDFSYENNNDKHPMGGYMMPVRMDIMRGRYRNSFSKPDPFVPGEVTPVRFVMADAAHTFKQGHRIMVQVQSSWFPLTDRNPQQFVDIYHCDDSDFIESQITIHHAPGAYSRVIVPMKN